MGGISFLGSFFGQTMLSIARVGLILRLSNNRGTGLLSSSLLKFASPHQGGIDLKGLEIYKNWRIINLSNGGNISHWKMWTT
jgi:hypothetical protein